MDMPTEGSSAGLTELLDALTTREDGPWLPDAGPASRAFAALVGRETTTLPLLATISWLAAQHLGVVDSAVFNAIGLPPPPAPFTQEYIVVPHGGLTPRYDLLVLDGRYVGPPRTVELPALLPSTQRPLPVMAWLSSLRHAGIEANENIVFGAAFESWAIGPRSLVVAQRPGEEPTGCPSPSMGLYRPGGDPTTYDATVGMVVRDATGILATTALHAVTPGNPIALAWAGESVDAAVESVHQPTDSCVLRLGTAPWCANLTDAPVTVKRTTPSQGEPVAFDGWESKRKDTWVTGWDLSILTTQGMLGSKVYTRPDTVGGDSGAALQDHHSEVIGFASYRSAYGEPIEYSAWVWAEQVVRAHPTLAARFP